MRGRKPTPTNMKIINGNPGKRPLSDGEPHPDPALPTPPDFLDDEARREWDRIAPELYELGLLTRLDRAALAAYCQSYAHWIKAETALRAAWQTGEDGEIDSAKLKRLSVLCNRALREMHSFLSEFGMTPAARTRLHIDPPCEDDPMAAFLDS